MHNRHNTTRFVFGVVCVVCQQFIFVVLRERRVEARGGVAERHVEMNH